MARLVRAIHVFLLRGEDVDSPHKAGQDRGRKEAKPRLD
jgi:hypothetical protein